MEKSSEEIIHRAPSLILSNKGSINDQYEIDNKILGEGGFAVTKIAVNKINKQKYAVKIIKKALDTQKIRVEKDRIMFEISILQELDHPHICRVIDFFEDNRFFYIVEELINGGDLFDYIDKVEQIDEYLAAKFMKQTIKAIKYCHSKNVIHRDLKPENLMLHKIENQMYIKVIDFGASSLFETQKFLTECTGTFYYIAPEVLNQKYNQKADIWSIGVILHVLLVGEPPFQGQNDAQIIKQVKGKKINFASKEYKDISKEAIDLLKHLLERDPEKRFTADEALTHPWFKLIKQKQIQKKDLISSLTNIKQFRKQNILQNSITMFIMDKILNYEEKMKIMEVFESLDVKQEGFLSKEQIIDGYKKLTGEDISKFYDLNQLDLNNDGKISYSEWMLAAIDKEEILTNKYMKQAFDLLDTNHDGSLDQQEISKIFDNSGEQGSKILTEMISQFDQDGDNKISFAEFQNMMISYSKKNQKENFKNRVKTNYVDPIKLSEQIENSQEDTKGTYTSTEEEGASERTKNSFNNKQIEGDFYSHHVAGQERKNKQDNINYCTVCNIY